MKMEIHIFQPPENNDEPNPRHIEEWNFPAFWPIPRNGEYITLFDHELIVQVHAVNYIYNSDGSLNKVAISAE